MGRGSHGRHWISEDGGLYLSYQFLINGICRQSPLRRLLDVVVRELSCFKLDVRIKQPNDLLLEERKFMGVIAHQECIAGDTYLTLSVGLNVSQKDLPPQFTSLNQYTNVEPIVIEQLIDKCIIEIYNSMGAF